MGSRAVAVLFRGCRTALLAAVLSIALLGAATTSPLVPLVFGPLAGCLAAGVVGLVDPEFPSDPGARRTSLVAGLLGTAAVPFGAGLGGLGPATGPVIAALLVLLSFLAVLRLVGVLGGRRVETDPDDVARLRRELSSLPTGEVLVEWRRTEEVLRAAPDAAGRARAAQLRALLLDELTRRDPVGVAHWVRDGGDPFRLEGRDPAG